MVWHKFRNITNIGLSLTFGLGFGLLLTLLMGENPLVVMSSLFWGAFGSLTNFGYTLYYATPLIFTGLSVSYGLKSGLFNIGAEGQMCLGGVAMAAVGILFPHLPAFLAVPFALFVGSLAGGIWGAIAGWLKAYRNCHEVLATILLNFVAYGIASYFIFQVLVNPNSQAPETLPVGEGFGLPALSFLGGTSPLNLSFFFAVATVLVAQFVLSRTVFGFRQRMSGEATELAKRAGLNVKLEAVKTFFVAGGFAGLAGASEILGLSMKAREGFAAGSGFVGIAVALLAGESLVGVIPAAILFGALHKGSLNLELDTVTVTRDLALVIQAVAILTVVVRKGRTR